MKRQDGASDFDKCELNVLIVKTYTTNKTTNYMYI